MKIKAIQNKNDRELLKVVLGKKDSFDYATASRLTNTTQEFLLPFTFSGDSTHPDLYYDLTGSVPLTTFMAGKISETQFKQVIGQLATALDIMNASGLQEKNLLLESKYVFLKVEDSSLQLAYLPLSGRVADDKAVLNLLREFSGGAAFVSDEDKVSADEFSSFLRKQEVLSVIAIKNFLEGENALPNAPKAAVGTTAATGRSRSKSAGRDFVGEQSGVLSRSQITEKRSVSDNIIAAVSERFDAPDDIKYQNAVVEAPPSEGKESSAQDATSIEAPPAIITEAPITQEEGTTFLDSSSAPHYPEQAAKGDTFTYWLVRESDGKKWQLPEGDTVIGRSVSSDLQVSESTMLSRQHAVVNLSGTGVAISDNGSKNGTFVNGQRIEPKRQVAIDCECLFKLGDIAFKITKVE